MIPGRFEERIVYDDDGTGEPDEEILTIRAIGNSHHAVLETPQGVHCVLLTRDEVQRMIRAFEQALEVMA